MKLHIFNPENDLALADGGANYSPPPAAAGIAHDLCTLPLWFADTSDTVLLQGKKHLEYYNAMSGAFVLPHIFSIGMQQGIAECQPWGWSPQILRRLKAMGIPQASLPSNSFIEEVRRISNRRTSIEILEGLAGNGIEVPPLPQYIEEKIGVKKFIESMPRCVVKAPWSGSGKGILGGVGQMGTTMEQFCSGIIKRQGGVICEHYFDSVLEFAMEFHAENGKVSFAGYSLFSTTKGAYSGNILASDNAIESFIARYIPLEKLSAVRETLCAVLAKVTGKTGYRGYMGIDMMLYKDDYGTIRLHPCIELNFRMNMGMLSRIFYDSHVHAGKSGVYRVEYFRESGEALAMHIEKSEKNPLVVENGKVVSGYINLSPVTQDSHYIAYSQIADSDITALYTQQFC